MFNPRILLILSSFFLFSQTKTVLAQNSLAETPSPKKFPISFTLSESATTSAGVYKQDGTLLRTLWGAVKYSAGTHVGMWDGLDDNGKYIFDTSYRIKLLTNNITYNWDGVVGNTSSTFVGSSIHHGYDIFKGMAIVGNTGYAGIGYNEAWPSKEKIDLNNPQSKTWILPSFGGTTQYTSHVTTDGTIVYWAELDPYTPSRYWVHGTKVSDDTQYSFTGFQDQGFTPKHSITYQSVIDLTDNAKEVITGLTVQKTGRFLFVAHGDIDEVHVFDKTTGIFIKKLSVNNPRGLCTDNEDNLWMISGNNTVARYDVNVDGSLKPAAVSLRNLANALAIQVSYDGSVVCVVDGGGSQQVKAFSNNTGLPAWTLGQPGGYTTNSSVANDKFMFDSRTYIAFQSDGSFWVGDPGNNRNQHFSGNNSFINSIAYLPKNYVISVDENNPTRVFAGLLEFAVDYSKTLAPANGSWALVKNWGYNAPAANDVNESLKTTYTLSNGRTYSVVRDGIKKMELVELVAGGNMRRTGVTYTPDYWLSPDGSLMKQWTPEYTGGFSIWVKKPLNGFDGSNNPIFGREIEIERVAAGPDDPAYRGQGMTYKPNEITTTGIRPNFDGTNKNIPFHIGGVKDGKYLWKTAKSTHYEYDGPFPVNGDYDIGNDVNEFAGSNALALERSIFWGYHGEFWKQGQVNIWNHLYDNGLMLGQFGTSEGSYKEGYPAMAGNGFSTKLVKVGDNYYLYHNDESYHSGVHRFSIGNLNTIKEQIIPVKDAVEGEVPADNSVNLMTGLPFKSVLKDGTAGWSRSFKNDSKNFTAKTSVKTYNKNNGDDIFMTFDKGAGNCNVTRDLGVNTGLSGWKLWGEITWAGSTPNYTIGKGGIFLEVLDNAGKVITSFYYTTNYGSDATHIKGNNVEITSGEINYIQSEVAGKLQPLEISASNGAFTFKYGDFEAVVTNKSSDAAANWRNPKTLRIKFVEDNLVNYDKKFDVANMRFSKDSIAIVDPVVLEDTDDLMQGLPYKSSLVDGTEGWNRSSKTDGYYFTAKTSIKTDNTDNGDDIYMTYNEGAGNTNVTRSLGTNTGVSGWILSGKVTWAGSTPNYTKGKGGVFLEVLDDAGKVITNFYYTTNYGNDATYIKGNNINITSGDINHIQSSIAAKLLPLEISVKSGICTFKYGDFDPVSTSVLADVTANWKNPRTLRVKFVEDNLVHYSKTFDVAHMRFSKTDAAVEDTTAVVNTDDLMKGLPYKSVLIDGTKGWSRSGKTESYYFSAKTSIKTDNTDNGDDIFMSFNEGSGNYNVTRDLGTNKGVSSWTLSGKVTWAGSTPNYTNGKGGVFLEVLDSAGKVITNFYYTTNYGNDATHVKGNGVDITSGDIGHIQSNVTAKLLPLQISVLNGVCTFKYGAFDPVSTTVLADVTADWKNPQTLRVKFVEDKLVHYSKTFDVANMRFSKGDAAAEDTATVANTDDLMKGLPYKSVLIDDTKGWNRSGKTESYYFSAKTSIKTDNTDNGDDIFMSFNEGSGNYHVTRDLGANKDLLSWKLAGKVTWAGCTPNYTNGKGGVFLEVLDDAGKVITTFCFTTNYVLDATHIKGNNVNITSGDIGYLQSTVTAKLQPLEISVINGAVTFKYAGFDAVSTNILAEANANWKNPATMRVKFVEDKLVHYGKTFDIANMIFSKKEAVPEKAPNLLPTVTLTSPVNNSAFTTINSVAITANASDEDGTIKLVEFYAGTEKIGTDATSPYSLTWNNIKEGTYTLTAKAIDNEGASTTSGKVKINVIEEDPCIGKGTINWQYWLGFGDSRVSYIPTQSVPTGSRTLTSFATPPEFADFYGSLVKGYICPPATGEYVFFLSTDDNGELWLSTDETVANKQKIAYVQGWTNVNEYDKYPSQRSFPVYLQAGKKYYVEALHQDGAGGDHLSVAWQLPDGKMERPIPGSRLIPFIQAESLPVGTNARGVANNSGDESAGAEELSAISETTQVDIYNPALDLKTYPNPFVNTLNIECAIPETGKYAVQIFTVQGVLIKTVFNGSLNAGISKFSFHGGSLSSGAYLVRLTSGRKVLNRQITLIR